MKPGITLHLCRRGALAALDDDDWRVDLDRMVLDRNYGTPPFKAGPLTYPQLVELITRANRVITW